MKVNRLKERKSEIAGGHCPRVGSKKTRTKNYTAALSNSLDRFCVLRTRYFAVANNDFALAIE